MTRKKKFQEDFFHSWNTGGKKKLKYYIIYTLVDKMDLMIFFFSFFFFFAAKIPERETVGITLSNTFLIA